MIVYLKVETLFSFEGQIIIGLVESVTIICAVNTDRFVYDNLLD